MIFNSSKKIIKERGITLYISVIVASFLILSSVAIISIAIRQVAVSSTGRDSQVAFYAADTGIECALYWDLKNPTVPGQSAFATTTPFQNIDCNKLTVVPLRVGATTTFAVAFTSPDTSCTTVTVAKGYSLGLPTTKIESKGYNYGTVSGESCISSNARRTERAVSVSF